MQDYTKENQWNSNESSKVQVEKVLLEGAFGKSLKYIISLKSYP